MKKIFRTVAALAVVMFAGCTNDLTNEVVAPVGGKTTVALGLEESRTSLGDLVEGTRKVYWSAGDQVVVNGVTSGEAQIDSENASRALFEFESALTHPYSVLYPAEMYKDAQTITLPATQDSATGSFAKGSAPMAGYQEAEGTTTLHHLAGVVRLQVTLPAESSHGQHQLNKVELRGTAGEQVSGDFAIDYANATLTALSTAEADKVVTTKVAKTLVAGETDDIFIVAPAREYTQGFTVRLIDDAGHYMDISSKAMTIEAGEIKAMPVVEFVPTGTLVGIEIKSAAELIAFAKAYNDGDYYGVEPFVVNITEDIVFDDATNAEWVPIGNKFAADNKLGLPEGDSNYWHGYLAGNGHSIKNWKSSRPLFAYTGGGSTIEELNIDASCTITANYTDNVEFYGTFVGYHRGILRNCTNNANLAVSGEWTNGVRVGGLVGRTVIGSIIECTNNGEIVLDNTVVSTTQSVCVGGITGYISNDDGYIEKCTNNALINVEGTATAMDCYIGGVVGACNGSVYDCINTESGVITSLIAAKTNYVGGITASADKNSKFLRNINHGQINFHVNATRNGDDNGRLCYLGGISGCGRGVISDNTNYGSIYSTSSSKMVYMGGIIGIAASDATTLLSNNTNDKDVVLESTGKGRYVYIGGLIGFDNYTAEAVVRDFTEDTGSILGTIRCNNWESKAETGYTIVALGGYVGRTGANPTITFKGANDGANIEFDTSTTANKAYSVSVGGLVGEAVGVLDVNNCELSNTIAIKAVTTMVSAITEMSVGGVVGLATKGGDFTNVTNKGVISWDSHNSKSNTKPVYTGGIVGSVKEGNTIITNCHNKANIFVYSYNNNAYTPGTFANHSAGIIGCYGWGTTDGTLTISDCSQEGDLWAYRGTVGGIAGYVRNATITNCSYTEGDIKNLGEAQVQAMAGNIAAIAANSTISGCVGKADMEGNTPGSTLYRIGGIVGILEGASTIDNCAYFGNITHYNSSDTKIAYVGGLAGLAENTTTIKNSKFGGSIWGNDIAETNYTEYISNVVSNGGEVYTPTIENCTYWDGN